jgi:hypothetical protein
VRLDRAFVTGAAEQALKDDGRFALGDPEINPPGQVNEPQARSIVIVYVKAVAPSLRGAWSALHESSIDTEALRPCDRALYAASPYTSFSTSVSEVVQRKFGPHWVVPMCDAGNHVQLVVSFSARATELTKKPDAGKQYPWEGGDFLSFGVPTNVASDLYSREAAAAQAFHRTGKRVSKVPTLVMSPMPTAPGIVRWGVALESPVRVRGKESGVARDRVALFVGFGSVLRESGLLDRKASANIITEWIDAVTKQPFTVVLSPLAPGGVEVVEKEGQ